MNHTNSSAESSTTPWLESHRESPFNSAKALNTTWIRNRKSEGWFLTLANAIYTEFHDQAQARMLTKLYFFLLEFMPTGLTGRWAHIDGQNVMEYLLTHTAEGGVARNTVTKGSAASFDALEKWMDGGNTWQDALEISRSGARKSKGLNGAGKKDAAKAKGLHSPAHLLALMVFDYPEKTYMSRIKELKITWMLDDDVDVREGFWKGFTDDDIPSTFQDDKTARQPAVELLVDYKRILGEDFVRCMEDMHPYLPDKPWAQSLSLPDRGSSARMSTGSDLSHLGLAHDGDIEQTGQDQGGEQDRGTGDSTPAVVRDKAPVDELPSTKDDILRLFLPVGEPDDDEIEEWLADWIIADMGSEQHDAPFRFWYTSWCLTIDLALHFQDQLLIRSLLRQSAQRLRACHQHSPHTARCYMLLDLGDFLALRAEDGCMLQAHGGYQAYVDGTERLLRRVPSHHQEVVDTLRATF